MQRNYMSLTAAAVQLPFCSQPLRPRSLAERARVVSLAKAPHPHALAQDQVCLGVRPIGSLIVLFPLANVAFAPKTDQSTSLSPVPSPLRSFAPHVYDNIWHLFPDLVGHN